jgi:hypothetical protein
MSDVIFARPRTEYGSYVDFYRLITLSGYELIYFDEIDPASDNAYIMTMVNGENQSGYPEAKAEIILWDCEWRLDGDYPRIPGVKRVWASDKWYAGQIGAEYVLMGSHPGLPEAPLENCPKVWDVAMLAYLSPRRQAMVGMLESAGVRLAPRGWGMERQSILQQTHAMLQVHQLDAAPTIAPQRWALAAAFRKPMICEGVLDKGCFGYGQALWCEFGRLPEFVKLWRDDARLADYGNALHQFLCVEHTFRANIEATL